MKFLVFDTDKECEDAEAAISKGFGYPKPGVNAATGEIEPLVLTIRWDIFRKTKNGKFIISSPDKNIGVDYDENWFDKINENALKSYKII